MHDKLVYLFISEHGDYTFDCFVSHAFDGRQWKVESMYEVISFCLMLLFFGYCSHTQYTTTKSNHQLDHL